IQDADRILQFSFTFYKPNPWDVEADFMVPLERLAEESGASLGETKLKGEELNEELVEDLSRSAASTGHDAKATIMDHSRSTKRFRISLRSKFVSIDIDFSNIKVDK